MLKKLIVSLGVIAIGSALVLSPQSLAKTKLKWAMWGSAQEVKYWKSLTAAFEKENPDIDVELFLSDWDQYHTKLLNMIAAGTPPDVMLVDGYYFPKFAGSGVLKPVDQYIKNDRYDMNKFYKAALIDISYNGRTYGLPWGFGPHTQYYNLSLFKKLALEDPYVLQQRNQWTWDNFLNAGKKLSQDTNGDGKLDQCGTYQALSHPWISPWLWSNGGGVLDETKKKVIINSKATIEAIEFQDALASKYHIAPKPSESVSWDAGKVGVTTHWFTGALWWKPLSKKFDWNVVPYPRGKAGQFTILKGNVNAMSGSCKNPKAAWKLIKFAASEEFETGIFKTGFWWSANRKFNQSKVVREAIPGLHTDVFDACSQDYAHLLPINSNYQRMEELINEGFAKFNAKKGSAQQIFDDVAKQIERLVVKK